MRARSDYLIASRRPPGLFDCRSAREKSIEKSLKKLSNKNTTLVIAHRLSTIIDADKIIVLEKGIIAEQGSHKELIKKNGLYAEMWLRQQEKLN